MVTMHNTTVRIDDANSVSGLWSRPADARAAYVLAHGAGAGMNHSFMADVADGLARRGVATLRFQFPFMEQGSKRTDRPAVAHAAVRAAVDRAADLFQGLPLFAGGKSFGGRMTSQAEAEQPMPAVQGLIFLGFPLHAANQPASSRGGHLSTVRKPMLFLQGTRDALADLTLMRAVADGLGPRASLLPIEGADHSFHVLVRSGRTDAAVMNELLDAASNWIDSRLKSLDA